MDNYLLSWNSSIEAQRQADEAYSQLKDKPKAKKPKKKKTPSQRDKQRRRNKSKSRFEYRSYITSKRWKRKRAKAIKFYGAKCQQCGSLGPLHVHHKSYKRLGNETMEDLEVLCKFCHEDRHADNVLPTDPISEQFRAAIGE